MRRPKKGISENYAPPNITDKDDPIRVLAKRLACTWTSWERIDASIRKAVAETSPSPKPLRRPKPRRRSKAG